jgi:hypothetical protein
MEAWCSGVVVVAGFFSHPAAMSTNAGIKQRNLIDFIFSYLS